MVSASESTRCRFAGRLQLEASEAPFVCARALAADCRAAPRRQSDPGIVRIRAAPDVRAARRQVHAASQNPQGQEQISVHPQPHRGGILATPAAARCPSALVPPAVLL